MITPFAAAVPYNAAAEGPFTISMLSISSGLKSFIREIDCPPFPKPLLCEPFSTRMPSTTSSGSLVREMLLEPRMRILLAVPAEPLALMICTPAARPWIMFERLVGAISIAFVASILVITLAISRLRCSPVAVTTISSRLTTAVDSWKLT